MEEQLGQGQGSLTTIWRCWAGGGSTEPRGQALGSPAGSSLQQSGGVCIRQTQWCGGHCEGLKAEEMSEVVTGLWELAQPQSAASSHAPAGLGGWLLAAGALGF